MSSSRPRLVIAGASGFIGRWFIEHYRQHYQIIALSRRSVAHNPFPEVEWRQVELYSMSSTQAAVAGADYGLYLVHSMNPSARLNQGSFEDTDLLLADNFARAAEAEGLKHLVFIGGILPKESGDFSRHLRSRYEVEQTLGARAVPLTTLRAGIIIGPGGSSFRIVRKLVENLPVMACPQWCENRSQPLGIEQMLQIIHYSFGRESLFGEALEVGGPESCSYTDLLRMAARKMGKRRWIFPIPIETVGFSKMWVARFTSSSGTLVSPLVESLRHTMTIDSDPRLAALVLQWPPLPEIVKQALEQADVARPRFNPDADADQGRNTVRSFQRLPNPLGLSAVRIARLYRAWLPRFLRYIIRARLRGPVVEFYLAFWQKPMLELHWVAQRSDEERQLFYIAGGWLVGRKEYGWLEFRSVLQKQHVIAAIHEFVPRLPWYLYLQTQARLHLWVMRAFGRYLQSKH